MQHSDVLVSRPHKTCCFDQIWKIDTRFIFQLLCIKTISRWTRLATLFPLLFAEKHPIPPAWRKRSDRMEATATHLRPKKCSSHFEFVSSKTSAHNCHTGLLRAIFIFCIFDYLCFFLSLLQDTGCQAAVEDRQAFNSFAFAKITTQNRQGTLDGGICILNCFQFACTKLAPHS